MDSLVSRSWLLVAVSMVCVVITLLLTRTAPAVAVVALIAALVPGLSAGWFFVGGLVVSTADALEDPEPPAHSSLQQP